MADDGGWRHDLRPVRRIRRADRAAVDDSTWPANLPAVAQLLEEGLDLPPGVTFLVGENGSGKSTLVEAVAGAYGLNVEGGTRQSRHQTRASESSLSEWLQLERGAGASRDGFFLRAESMHSHYTYLEDVAAAARDAGLPHRAGRAPAYHEMSHGESFLAVIAANLTNPGLYCLDEPEAALSFTSVLALVGRLAELTLEGAQVLCATHSPVLCALPEALILEVGDWGLRETTWDDLQLVEHHRQFLRAPERYLRHVMAGPA